MSLAPGQRVGPYEITAKLGEVGMGQVFRAKDFQLGRNVALEVLPEGFTRDTERLARFEREAKLLAQLNHPNIAQIYGLEVLGETRALVMELVDGPTLAERHESGPLPFNECLSVSSQIAQALEEAHDKGIVHRDLEPQNIKASMEGKVKVLDFGLAKAMHPAGGVAGMSPQDLAHSPTVTLGGTREAMILGTAAYMAPEQARGSAVEMAASIGIRRTACTTSPTRASCSRISSSGGATRPASRRSPRWRCCLRLRAGATRRLGRASYSQTGRGCCPHSLRHQIPSKPSRKIGQMTVNEYGAPHSRPEKPLRPTKIQ